MRANKYEEEADFMNTQKISYTIPEFCAAAGIGRSTVYEEIKSGRLSAVKCRNRTLIPAESARVWLDSLKADAATITPVA